MRYSVSGPSLVWHGALVIQVFKDLLPKLAQKTHQSLLEFQFERSPLQRQLVTRPVSLMDPFHTEATCLPNQHTRGMRRRF